MTNDSHINKEKAVTVVSAPHGFFYGDKYPEIQVKKYNTSAEALSELFWHYHRNEALQAFIIDESGQVINDIHQLKNTMGLATRSVYGIQAITEQGELIVSEEVSKLHSGCTVPTLDEALDIANRILEAGYHVKVGLPNGTVLYKADIEKYQS
ncbi:hypothetical protein [Acinetobacter populi]|jgi:hypothetical protein|uniref:Uncharacterized protein n=1 Tax=Acinetobacter populi TaxID=1582270 RepID=A0A1Z9Z1M1_9GAMM|nr:hypothetical protein [Acinetobacter populi]MCH4246284.1 hypothetical protein [Acinetobacter populi]OUY08336.1 hypothetical protein CAP51_01550 [Acinetobacter populi]